jgi:hypothetical protein
MNHTFRISTWAALLAAALLAGCSTLFPSGLSTMDGCISSFMDYLDIQPNLIPNELSPSAKDYEAAANSSFWNASGFPLDETFALLNQNISGNACTATLVSTHTYRNGVPIVFGLTQLPDGNYAIISITVNGVCLFD